MSGSVVSRRRSMVVALGAASMVVAACGGDESASVVSIASTPTTAATTVPETTTPSTTESSASSSAPDTTTPATTAPTTPITTPITTATIAPTATAATETDAGPDTTSPLTELTVDDGSATVDPTGEFSVVFPGEPTEATIPVPELAEDAQVSANIVEDPDAAFLASRIDYDEFGADASTISLSGARDGAVVNTGGTLGNSETVTIDGRDAIRYDFTVDGGVAEGLVALDGLVLYQVLALGVPERQADYDAFLDSFMFTDGGS